MKVGVRTTVFVVTATPSQDIKTLIRDFNAGASRMETGTVVMTEEALSLPFNGFHQIACEMSNLFLTVTVAPCALEAWYSSSPKKLIIQLDQIVSMLEVNRVEGDFEHLLVRVVPDGD